MSQRALLLVNPHARQGKKAIIKATYHLQKLGLQLVVEDGSYPQKYSQLVRQYNERVDLVIIGGGDGSINAAIEGLLDTELPLGIIPLGTANNLARTLQIPNSIVQACQIIARGKAQFIDIGWVNGQYFLNIASLGLSAEVNQRVSKRLKKHWDVFAYILTAIQALVTIRSFWVDIYVDRQSIETKTIQITIANGRYYGSGLVIADDAAIDDERLDLHSLEIQHWRQILPLLPAAFLGKSPSGEGVRLIRGKDIEIITRKSHPIHTDGEQTTKTPARFRVIPHALKVIA
jgi:diacylglycerol kinase (ATP)